MSQLDVILSATSVTVPITQHPYQTVHTRTAQLTKIKSAGPNKTDSVDISDEAVKRYNESNAESSGSQNANNVSDYDSSVGTSAEMEASRQMVSQQNGVGKTFRQEFRV
ncbi:MAG: hypothetical protein NTV54_16750 [Ignavibacteriales bacterium]|nr:hypothetical protein [Ignavibacteriales bacterium]